MSAILAAAECTQSEWPVAAIIVALIAGTAAVACIYIWRVTQ